MQNEMWPDGKCFDTDVVYERYMGGSLTWAMAGRANDHQEGCDRCASGLKQLLDGKMLRTTMEVELHIDVPRANALYLDGELEDDLCSELDRHLLTCRQCETLWDAETEARWSNFPEAGWNPSEDGDVPPGWTPGGDDFNWN